MWRCGGVEVEVEVVVGVEQVVVGVEVRRRCGGGGGGVVEVAGSKAGGGTKGTGSYRMGLGLGAEVRNRLDWEESRRRGAGLRNCRGRG